MAGACVDFASFILNNEALPLPARRSSLRSTVDRMRLAWLALLLQRRATIAVQRISIRWPLRYCSTIFLDRLFISRAAPGACSEARMHLPRA